MKRNMKEWVAECINNPVKKAMPNPLFSGCTDYRTHSR